MKSKILLPSLVLPAAFSLLVVGICRDESGQIFRVALVLIPAFSVGAGLWIGIRTPPGKSSRVGAGLAMAGLVFTVNLFVLFMGCAPQSGGSGGGGPLWEHRPNASSRKEMAKVAGQIPSRDDRLTADALNLAPYYNATLTEFWQTKVGPANLSKLPTGLQEMAAITFDVRGVIRTCSRPKEDDGKKFPPAVRAIQVDRLCHRLHFLHGYGWDAPRLTSVATYVIHYEDGQTVTIPVVYGRDVLKSWFLSEQEEPEARFIAEGGKVVWKKSIEVPKPNPPGPKTACRLFLTTWQNPRPEVKIVSLDLKSSTEIFATPFLVALTIDSNP